MAPVGVIENGNGKGCHAAVLDHVEFMQGKTIC